MPKLGEVGYAKKIGKEGTCQYVWQICITCGKERWVRLRKGKPQSIRCLSCASRLRAREGKGVIIWKGGRFRTGDGHILIKVLPDDFFFPMVHSQGYVLEHRLIMAKHLGRCLQQWEEVHHKNEIKDDNTIENLVIRTKGNHQKEHHKGYQDGFKQGFQDGKDKQIKSLKLEIIRLKEQLGE